MLVDRYAPVQLFELVPQLYAAFKPVLRDLDRLLDDDAIVARIRADLARPAPYSLSRGRPGTPVEVILRLLVVKRLSGRSSSAASCGWMRWRAASSAALACSMRPSRTPPPLGQSLEAHHRRFGRAP